MKEEYILNDHAVLKVNHLSAAFDTEAGRIQAVDDISFQVYRGKTLGIVLESICGKSITELSIMRLLPQPARKILDGQILCRGTDIRPDGSKIHVCPARLQYCHNFSGAHDGSEFDASNRTSNWRSISAS